MDEEHTTAVVQRYLDELGGDAPAESAVRALLDRAVRRLHELCAAILHRVIALLSLRSNFLSFRCCWCRGLKPLASRIITGLPGGFPTF